MEEEVGTWCSLSSRSLSRGGSWSWSRRSSAERQKYERIDGSGVDHLPPPPAKRPRRQPLWRAMWRKLKKEKKRIFDCSASARFTYDPFSYAQNFDQGSSSADPDDLSRSFSARFAVSSIVFENDGGGRILSLTEDHRILL